MKPNLFTQAISNNKTKKEPPNIIKNSKRFCGYPIIFIFNLDL